MSAWALSFRLMCKYLMHLVDAFWIYDTREGSAGCKIHFISLQTVRSGKDALSWDSERALLDCLLGTAFTSPGPYVRVCPLRVQDGSPKKRREARDAQSARVYTVELPTIPHAAPLRTLRVVSKSR